MAVLSHNVVWQMLWGPDDDVAPPPPPPSTPSPLVFQSINNYIENNPRIANTITSINPHEYNRPARLRHDVVFDGLVTPSASLLTPTSGNRSPYALYDKTSDMLFTVNPNQQSMVCCIDPRSMLLQWKNILQQVSYYGASIIGTSTGKVWFRAYNASYTTSYVIGLNILTGTVDNSYTLPDPIVLPGKGSFATDNGWDAWWQVLNDDTISLGQWFDNAVSENFMIYLKIVDAINFTLGFVSFPAGNHNTETLWTNRVSYAYALSNINHAVPGDKLVQVIDLSSMSIVDVVTVPVPYENNMINPSLFMLNDNLTRAYISDYGGTYGEMFRDNCTLLEFDITTPGWTYLGAYGSNRGISNGQGYQADEYVVVNDTTAYAITGQYQDSFPGWWLGGYSTDADFFGSMWGEYQWFNIPYGFHEFKPFESFNAAYNPGHANDWWVLPASNRAFTPPSYAQPLDVTPLTAGINSTVVPLSYRVTWCTYYYDGLHSLEFSSDNGSVFFLYLFDSAGKLLEYDSGYKAYLSRNVALPGTYYLAIVYCESYQMTVGIGDGWTINTSALGSPSGLPATATISTSIANVQG